MNSLPTFFPLHEHRFLCDFVYRVIFVVSRFDFALPVFFEFFRSCTPPAFHETTTDTAPYYLSPLSPPQRGLFFLAVAPPARRVLLRPLPPCPLSLPFMGRPGRGLFLCPFRPIVSGIILPKIRKLHFFAFFFDFIWRRAFVRRNFALANGK